MTTTTRACTILDMNDIARSIKRAREAAGLNQSELARLLDISPQAVQKWEAGETLPRGRRMQQLCEALNVSVAELMDGNVSSGGLRLVSDRPGAPSMGKTVVVPRLDVTGSMGHGSAQPDGYVDIIERMSVSADWVRQSLNVSNPNNLAIITGRGDSMESTFTDGDLLLVDRGVNELRMDAVYVMAIEGDLYIKRIQRQPGGVVVMISDNPRYAPIEIKPAELDGFRVLARVLLVWNAHKM